MFVQFTAIAWDNYVYFTATTWETYVSTDLVARVEASGLDRWLQLHGDGVPESDWRPAEELAQYAERDQRHLYRGKRYTDIIFISGHGSTPERVTVEGAVEDVLMRIEFRS